MISGILLAGGKSSRMGQDKALMEFRGEKLYQYSLAVLEHFCDDIILSSSSPALNKKMSFPVVPDDKPGLGPIGGIATCLKQIKNEKAIILSCDIPLISKDYISFLLQFQTKANIVCGKNPKGFPEPLAGIYDKSILPSIQEQIDREEYKMGQLLKKNNALLVDIPEGKFDPSELFMNINTPEDFRRLGRVQRP